MPYRSIIIVPPPPYINLFTNWENSSIFNKVSIIPNTLPALRTTWEIISVEIAFDAYLVSVVHTTAITKEESTAKEVLGRVIMRLISTNTIIAVDGFDFVGKKAAEEEKVKFLIGRTFVLEPIIPALINSGQDIFIEFELLLTDGYGETLLFRTLEKPEAGKNGVPKITLNIDQEFMPSKPNQLRS